jgi:hypothetical protein
MPSRFLTALALCVSFTAVVAAEAPKTCKLVTTDAPGAAGGTFIFGINDKRLLSGYWNDAYGASHGALWEHGHFRSVDYPGQGSFGLSLFATNRKGRVAGGYYDANGVSHAVIYDVHSKKFELLADFPGSSYNAAGSIDNRGRVSGNYTLDPNQSSQLVAWLYTGNYDYYVAAGSDQSRLGTVSYGMNDDATIVGFYLDAAGTRHGYTRAVGKVPVPFDVPGSTRTRLLGINDDGVLSGDYKSGGVPHGLIFYPEHEGRPGRVDSVDFAGATATVVAAVNNIGDIAGYYADARGQWHGFVGLDCLRE